MKMRLSVATAQTHHHSYWGIQGKGTLGTQGNGCMDDDIYDTFMCLG